MNLSKTMFVLFLFKLNSRKSGSWHLSESWGCHVMWLLPIIFLIRWLYSNGRISNNNHRIGKLPKVITSHDSFQSPTVFPPRSPRTWRLCMYIYIYIYIYTNIYTCYIYTHIYLHMCIYIYIYKYMYMYALVSPPRSPRTWRLGRRGRRRRWRGSRAAWTTWRSRRRVILLFIRYVCVYIYIYMYIRIIIKSWYY